MEIFFLRPSTEDDRPTIDFTMEHNKQNDWDAVNDVVSGDRPADSLSIDLVATDPGWQTCGLFLLPGTLGLFRQEICDLIARRSDSAYAFIPATVNDVPYGIPVAESYCDCLDQDRSKVEKRPSPPYRIFKITQYEFLTSKIEDAFTLPIGPKEIYVTTKTKTEIESLKFKDIDYVKVWSSP